jgi:hypothetical protein
MDTVSNKPVHADVNPLYLNPQTPPSWRTTIDKLTAIQDAIIAQNHSKAESAVASDVTRAVGWDRVSADKEGPRLKIYVDRKEYLYGHLTPANLDAIQEYQIELVDSPDQADVLYLIDHTYRTVAPVSTSSGSVQQVEVECEHLKAGKVCNQFSWEGLLVTKQMLCKTINTAYGVYIHPTGNSGIGPTPAITISDNIGTASSTATKTTSTTATPTTNVSVATQSPPNSIDGMLPLVMDLARLPPWTQPSFDLSEAADLWSFVRELYAK